MAYTVGDEIQERDDSFLAVLVHDGHLVRMSGVKSNLDFIIGACVLFSDIGGEIASELLDIGKIILIDDDMSLGKRWDRIVFISASDI